MRTRFLGVLVLAALVACGGSKGHSAIPTPGKKTTTTPPLHAEHDLTAGKHFGFVTALDPGHFRLVFDKAELLSGDAAKAAAQKEHSVVTQGGHYVENPDDRMNNLTIDEHVVVKLLTPCCELHEVSFDRWLSGFDTGDDRAFYGTKKSHYEVTIENKKVVEVDEVLVD